MQGKPVKDERITYPVQLFINMQNGYGLPKSIYEEAPDTMATLRVLEDEVAALMKAIK